MCSHSRYMLTFSRNEDLLRMYFTIGVAQCSELPCSLVSCSFTIYQEDLGFCLEGGFSKQILSVHMLKLLLKHWKATSSTAKNELHSRASKIVPENIIKRRKILFQANSITTLYMLRKSIKYSSRDAFHK